MSALQMPRIKRTLKMFIYFFPWQRNYMTVKTLTKILQFQKQIILLQHTEIWIICANFWKSESI